MNENDCLMLTGLTISNSIPDKSTSSYDGIGLTGKGAATGESLWRHIQDAEVDVSLVKPEYLLKGTLDLIRGDGDTVEIVDFKSEKRPDLTEQAEAFERYKRQLEVYAHLVEEKTGKNVSKMHLYYTVET